jgi:hypothetical protein
MIMKRRRALTGLLALTLGLETPEPALGGTMTGASTEWTQISNFVTLCMGIVQQIQMVVSLAQTVRAWTTTLKAIDSPDDVMRVAQGTKSIINRTRALGYAGKMKWKQVHPGRVDPQLRPGASGASRRGAANLNAANNGDLPSASGHNERSGPDEEAFDEVDEGLQNAVESLFEKLDLHGEDADELEDVVDKLAAKMQTVEGARAVGMMTNELLMQILQMQFRLLETMDACARVTGEHASSEAQYRQYQRSIQSRRHKYTGRFRGND